PFACAMTLRTLSRLPSMALYATEGNCHASDSFNVLRAVKSVRSPIPRRLLAVRIRLTDWPIENDMEAPARKQMFRVVKSLYDTAGRPTGAVPGCVSAQHGNCIIADQTSFSKNAGGGLKTWPT